jgi:hypothetical protein
MQTNVGENDEKFHIKFGTENRCIYVGVAICLEVEK